jgi:hypothetical protein
MTNRRKSFWFLPLALLLSGTTLPNAAVAQNSGPGNANNRPLNVQIDSEIDFGVAALDGRSGGSIDMDPVTGERRVTGGLVSVGGNYFSGKARITGTPFARVRIGLPQSIKMNAKHGSKAVVASFSANVPPVVTLDGNGEASFTFAGRFSVESTENGEFQGRFAITADYE